MEKKILLLLIIIPFSTIYAQVGINIQSPQGWFHIDPLGNTAGANNGGDDVIISMAGNVGIGTLNPSTKLHIQSTTAGAIRIVDGTQGVNKVLTSDANGVGKWELAKGSFVRGYVIEEDHPVSLPPPTPLGFTWVLTKNSIKIPPHASCIISAAAQFMNASANALQPGLFLAFSTSNTVFVNASPNKQTIFNRVYIPAVSYTMCAGFVTDIKNNTASDMTLYMWASCDNAVLNEIFYNPHNTVNDLRLYAITN